MLPCALGRSIDDGRRIIFFFNVETIKEKERDHYFRKPAANVCNICLEEVQKGTAL